MHCRTIIVRLLSGLLFLGAILVHPRVFAGNEIDNTPSGTLYLRRSAQAPATQALRVATRMHVQVTGNVARVRVEQEFSNSGDDWVEGLYVFPLSKESAVDDLLMHIGERTIRGEVQEKAKAEALYAEARAEGRRASIVDQERPNLFTSAVANIAPHAAITIEIAYLETLPLRDGRYTLNLPLAITPRYTPGAPQDATASMPAATAALLNTSLGTTATPERVQAASQNVSIDVELEPGFALSNVASLHHAIQVQTSASGRHVHLQSAAVPADRDFDLVWTPADASALTGAVFAESLGGETFTLLMLSPPQHLHDSTLPREVTFIIDTSGSMGGPSIEQARAALSLGIDRLKPTDRFNIIRFASDYSALFDSPQAVTDSTRTLAGRFIQSLRADGGTEMRAPLDAALSSSPAPEFLQQIVFITDGSVSNEAELIGLIHDRIGTKRLFTVGIGAAPNAYFLGEAAAAGRGSYTFIADRDEVGARMRDLFQKLENPALVDLRVRWPEGVNADLAAPLPQDLYSGDPVVVLARMPRTVSGEVVLSGRVRGVEWTQHVPLTTVGDASGLAKLWARERIGDLSRQMHYGGDSEALKASIIELALEHHLVSEFTSLVAVDDEVVRAADAAGHVEQAATSAPVGGAWATTGFAKTATAAELCLLTGLGCLGLGLLLRPMARAESLRKTVAVVIFLAAGALLGEAVWIHLKAGAAQLLIGAAWRGEHVIAGEVAPWPWADTRPIAKLTWGDDGAAPTLMVLEGASGRNLAFGPVHDSASVAPGAIGNSVIEGHRDTHFKILRDARPGDHVSIETLDGSMTRFVVTDARVVDSRQTRIALDADVPRLTLVTCYPFDAVTPGGPLRWLVTAEASTVETYSVNLDPLIDQAARHPTQFAVTVERRVDSEHNGHWQADSGKAAWDYAIRIPTAVTLGFHASRLSLPADDNSPRAAPRARSARP